MEWHERAVDGLGVRCDEPVATHTARQLGERYVATS